MFLPTNGWLLVLIMSYLKLSSWKSHHHLKTPLKGLLQLSLPWLRPLCHPFFHCLESAMDCPTSGPSCCVSSETFTWTALCSEAPSSLHKFLLIREFPAKSSYIRFEYSSRNFYHSMEVSEQQLLNFIMKEKWVLILWNLSTSGTCIFQHIPQFLIFKRKIHEDLAFLKNRQDSRSGKQQTFHELTYCGLDLDPPLDIS